MIAVPQVQNVPPNQIVSVSQVQRVIYNNNGTIIIILSFHHIIKKSLIYKSVELSTEKALFHKFKLLRKNTHVERFTSSVNFKSIYD